ncbi:MAG TPA: shikimate dehydrogenase [Smithella sp.]|nr:shikimate dehydrogenase [Smithella sp.]MDM7986446.1 shikimate dehydrogenase [Smithella sp.]HNY50284.1 shikimate dehydrogenase [Smithella sp.]HOG89883.1 shikimate dehydrogenase [Smithella sp.]HOU49797.1 shikimate dehydrogenase [Smithella sp.]
MICIPVTSPGTREAVHAIEKSCRFADFIELRMDLIGQVDLAELIAAVRDNSDSVQIIVTCRKQEEAAAAGVVAKRKKNYRSKKVKMALLKEAIELGVDFIDIELAEGSAVIHELKSLCAQKGSKTGMIVSYHNLQETPPLTELKKVFQQCVKFKPAIVKIVTTATKIEDNLITLNLISFARHRSQPIIALCMGEKGGISRAIAPFMGSYLSFATLERSGQSAPGQYTVHEMNQFQNWFNGSHQTASVQALSLQKSPPKNFVLLGNPVGHSLSPLMHNAALKKMGIDESYSAACVQDIGGAVAGIRGMNIHGASVTIPFKVAVMKYLDDLDDDALEIGAVNTIVNRDGILTGYNTDWLGLTLTLKSAMTIKNKTFVIIGAGGTARAAAYGIKKEGGIPVIVNRTPEKGKMLSGKLNCFFYPLSEAGRIKADCLINTTSVGMYPHQDKSPVNATTLTGYQYVMDVIYNPLHTKLLKDAQRQGCYIFSGADMFVHQGAEQLRLWTGKEPPRELMKKVILERLTKK